MSQPRTGFEQVNGVRLAYRHWTGPSNAQHPPVVLLHGVLQTGEGMRHLAEQLSLDREVLVPDLRGRGDSDRPGRRVRPADDGGRRRRLDRSARYRAAGAHRAIAWRARCLPPCRAATRARVRGRPGRCQSRSYRGSCVASACRRRARCRGRLLRTRTPLGSTKRVWDCLPTGPAMTSQVTSKQCQAAVTAGGMTSKSCAASRPPLSRDLIGMCWPGCAAQR